MRSDTVPRPPRTATRSEIMTSKTDSLPIRRAVPPRRRAAGTGRARVEVGAPLLPTVAPREHARRVAAARGVLPLLLGRQAVRDAVAPRAPLGEGARVVERDARDGQTLLAL